MSEESYQIKIPVYEGPMDLLVHVMRQHEVEPYEIPLAEIALAFLEYARAIGELDLDMAGEYLSLATLIMRYKMRKILPSSEPVAEQDDNENGEDRSEELEEIYREIVAAARILASGEEVQRQHFPRGNAAEVVAVDETAEVLKDVDIIQLAEAFREVSRRLEAAPVQQLALFSTSIEEQSKALLYALTIRERISFLEFVDRFDSRLEAIVAFLALLNLLRRQKITIRQDNLFDEIWIYQGTKFDEDEETDHLEDPLPAIRS